MSERAAPKDAAGLPIPAVLKLSQTLAWVLWRRPYAALLHELATKLPREEVVVILAKAQAEVEPYVRAGELPLRGKVVWYQQGRHGILSPPIISICPEYETIPPEALVDRQLNFLTSAVDTRKGLAEFAEVIVNRDDLLRRWPEPAQDERADANRPSSSEVNDGPAVGPHRSGSAGRPSAIHLVEQLFLKRMADGTALPSNSAEASELLSLLLAAYPEAPIRTVKTITNHLPDWRRKLCPK